MAGVVAGGLFNAIAFAGAGYVFHKLDKNGYEKEMKRYDVAMEKLSREKEKWYEKTVEKKSKIASLTQEIQDANKDFKDANKALRRLLSATEDLEDHEDVEPRIKDYYEPSDEMKKEKDRGNWSRRIRFRVFGDEIIILRKLKLRRRFSHFQKEMRKRE